MNSIFIFGLIIGLIIGWLIEWLIDWFYWRRDNKKLQSELIQAESKIRTLQSQLEEQRTNQHKTSTCEDDLQTCRSRLAESEATIDRLRAQLNELSTQTPTEKDRLERVKGIGAVFAKRLNEGGIYTFAQLAEQTPEHIREVIKPEEWQKFEPESWIAQAKDFAQSSSAKGV